jgi:hypothetical protein
MMTKQAAEARAENIVLLRQNALEELFANDENNLVEAD